jgi:hypothetical protein
MRAISTRLLELNHMLPVHYAEASNHEAYSPCTVLLAQRQVVGAGGAAQVKPLS